MDDMTLLAIAIGLPTGTVIGGFVGTAIGNWYAAWLNRNVPDWFMRPWWKAWWPRG